MNGGVAPYLAVGLGAAIGGICRYAAGVFFLSRFGPGFPFGTLFVNLSGSFLIGVVAELAQTRVLAFDPLLRVALTAGLLGGYTWRLELTYALGSIVLGVLACYLGIALTRLVSRPA